MFADSESIAEELFQAMAARATDQPIFLDVPEINQAALVLAARHKLRPVFETIRMYNNPTPLLDVSRIFGITSMELG